MKAESLDGIKSLIAAGEDIKLVLRQNKHFIRQAADNNQSEVKDFLLKLLYEQKPEKSSSIKELFDSLCLFKDPLLIPKILSFTKLRKRYVYDLIVFLLDFDAEDLEPFSEELILYLSRLLNQNAPYAYLVLDVIFKLDARKTIDLIINNGYLHHTHGQTQRIAISIFINAIKITNQPDMLNYVTDFLTHSDPATRLMTALNLKKFFPDLFGHLNMVEFVRDMLGGEHLVNQMG
ncbi:MAG TPA: hypothetical protein VLL52_08875 [Anaerolineae bacterium]|nr:hypothetical protein [Anaerolineae bacterium]